MFGFRYSWIFKSRWAALLWAAGICWMAVDFAGRSGDAGDGNASSISDGTGASVSPEDVRRIEDGLKRL